MGSQEGERGETERSETYSKRKEKKKIYTHPETNIHTHKNKRACRPAPKQKPTTGSKQTKECWRDSLQSDDTPYCLYSTPSPPFTVLSIHTTASRSITHCSFTRRLRIASVIPLEISLDILFFQLPFTSSSSSILFFLHSMSPYLLCHPILDFFTRCTFLNSNCLSRFSHPVFSSPYHRLFPYLLCHPILYLLP